MILTDEIAARYVGGQIEVHNQIKARLYRGEIGTIAVEGEGSYATLSVRLNWMAKGEGFPPFPARWVPDDHTTYGASLMTYSVSDIGDGCLALNSAIVGEIVVLFPPDGSKLDQSKVEGLNADEVQERRIRNAALDLLYKDRDLDDTKFTPPGVIGHGIAR
ncbi:MAG TPA: hypothetical protein VLE72_02865 [Candidatus Saccharimonadales bacterium]|nr:hypothetical protein [Candidatus Saccharimonadales bacterium]